MSDAYNIDWLAPTKRAKDAWKEFIARNGLRFEGVCPERIAVCYDEAEIRACAALDKNVVKYVAVDKDERDGGLASRLVSFVAQYALSIGRRPLFLFTKNENVHVFSDMGFGAVSSYAGVTLMEYPSNGVKEYSRSLEKFKASGTNGAVVINANPFTKGHLYLLKSAAEKVDCLHVFLVKEDLSVFPYDVRLALVREGTAEIPNICVHAGGRYVLSGVTFPAYFTKTADEAAIWQMGLDITVFLDHIVPALDIKARFVGDESADLLTSEYNDKMHKLLTPKGVDVIELQRLQIDGAPVSAEKVRSLLASGDLEGAKRLLPDCTGRFIDTDLGKEIIGRLI